MAIEAKSEIELAAIECAIVVARNWARKHFNHQNHLSATPLDPPSFKVSFPDVDRMLVEPMVYGRKCGPSMNYRLRFHNDGKVSWHPTEKLLGIKTLPDLFITVPRLDEVSK